MPDVDLLPTIIAKTHVEETIDALQEARMNLIARDHVSPLANL
jgi:hypothetical protein